MAVEIHEETVAWVTFTGEQEGLNGSFERLEYVMVFSPSYAQAEECWFLFASSDEGPPFDSKDINSELEIRSSIFARAVRRLGDGNRSADLGGRGAFDLVTNYRVKYTTDCGERHFFSLEDLLTLADIIDDTAIVTPVV